MAGLILLMALIAFVALLFWLSGLITKRMAISAGWKTLLRALIVAGAFPLLLLDEIIGRWQFEDLCNSYGIGGADISSARGKRINIHDDYRNWKSVPGTILPMEEVNTIIKEADGNTELVRYKNYRTDGGWIMRYSGLGMGGHGPMIFDGSRCDWAVTAGILEMNHIAWVKN